MSFLREGELGQMQVISTAEGLAEFSFRSFIRRMNSHMSQIENEVPYFARPKNGYAVSHPNTREDILETTHTMTMTGLYIKDFQAREKVRNDILFMHTMWSALTPEGTPILWAHLEKPLDDV